MKKALGLTKIHGDHKGLNVAIVKATNSEHVLPKEKHVRTIFQWLSPTKPRNEVIYCIHGLSKRLSKTNNWAVALKTLLVIHRAMRELDTSVWEEFVNFAKVRGYLIDLSLFHDSSVPNATHYSAWIRNYGLYLEERLRCFVIMNYDVVTYSSKYSQKFDTQDLMQHQLPSLQILLFRLLDCKVAGESVKLYVAITIRVVELLDKFFEMNRNDARNALQIYQKSISQAERLSEFFETCKRLDFGRGQKFPPASFMITMEEYIKETPSTLTLEYNMDDDNKRTTAIENEAIEGELSNVGNNDVDDKCKLTDTTTENSMTSTPPQAAELMGLYDLLTGASEFDENSLTMAIVPTDNCLSSSNDERGTSTITGWEVALFTEPESCGENVEESESKEVADLMEVSKLDNLDNLYDEAMTSTLQSEPYHISQVTSNPFEFDVKSNTQLNMEEAPSTMQNEFFAFPSPNMASPIPTQTVGMPYPDYYITLQQQQQHEPFIMNKKSTNPFDETNMSPSGMPTHSTQST
ncbi:hypothetical protein VNO77_22546 [Canavalia gladiata]|uniref:ENTH domain-containing protein n=1 Tax=Canavalia gladiata TaxID=3824 RepID=A0AAN9L2S9_CANGL